MKFFIDNNLFFSYLDYTERVEFNPVVYPLFPLMIYASNPYIFESEDGKYLENHKYENFKMRFGKEYFMKHSYVFETYDEAILYFSMKYNIIKEDSLEWQM